ncbi:transcriptional repressor [Clostridium sp. 19966]|uniref:Fur family transcriptional regulator n=1 Tax=Clostridium sp. 19966 TaxID=2768166 RepID=UPI0028DDAF01|nr:Fur family transcriptional regulator [Clostridium sp. 19966]MDT8718125.1 transcriptional repressor [Clostridium sp. 19966]
MNKHADEVNKLKDVLKEKGYKLTPQRRAIVDMIVSSEGKHLTAEEIYDLVKVECPEIGLATVYRTIVLLEEMGVISRLDLGDNCSRYELVHEEENHQHHHLICTVCNKVIEVEGDLLESLEENIEEKYKFKIKNHSVKFYGICSECAKKE